MYTRTPRGPGGRWARPTGPEPAGGLGWEHAAAGVVGVIAGYYATRVIEWGGAYAIAGCIKGSRWVKTKWKETKWAERD